jgi:GT2 family glycosyltransferase
MNAVDVIVPIYNAAADLQRLLLSLQNRVPSFARVVLIDDASTDPQIATLCRQFKEQASFACEYLTNARNIGFVGTVNGAIERSKNDLVLLNSDTIVTTGWLEALAARGQKATIASVTPWSNNAEICSFPNFCQYNAPPIDIEKLAQAARQLPASLADAIELPTGVGFCMYMTRNAIQAVGGFDHATFGRGYGEENDWCVRAAGHGFRNVFCHQAFIAHVGGQSFTAVGEKPGGENLKRLLARYPFYHQRVANFIETDPMQPLRNALQTALANLATT